ncbi:unnamed protein product [Cercopithifilaria johnstoni]|uniref:Globin domain-containing protein n=1 Tax=Cercopithifilaria johnstoni TaxID=2874296 RepID=A0A8J2LWT4_9BILA|nr:unnamed protein product [Cercopithifilaria johnstoni]
MYNSRRSHKERNRSLRRLDVSSKLTIQQQQALLTSWKSLRPIIQTVVRKILNNLEDEMPKVKKIFCQTAVLDAFNRESVSENSISGTLDEHIKLIIGFFDELVINVHDEENMSNKIQKIGQSHAILCSFNADIWEKLGEITMQCFSTQDIVQKTREAGKAWRILIAWVTDELRCGFDGRARINRRHSSLTTVEQSKERSAQHQYSPDIGTVQQQLQQLRFKYENAVP